MSNPVPKFSAEKVAKLARIDLPPDQIEPVQRQLGEVLSFVGQLNELDLSEVEPFFGTADVKCSLRSDQVQTSLKRDDVLENAPETDGEFYLVPPVFGS